MSWLYSRALVAAYSGANFSAGAPSALLSATPTPQAFLSPDRMKVFSRLSRFGMTFAPLTDALGEELLTWFRAASRARTFPQQAEEPASPEPEAVYGDTWRESSVKFDPVLRSWKTHRCLCDEDLPWSSVTLPRWGMIRAGVLWERMTPALHISEIESGSWPTPTCRDYKDGTAETAAKVPENSLLGRAVHVRHNPQPVSGGTLNPTWVEWLMGWPLGWTDLKPLETDKFQQWLYLHGKR